MALIIPPATLSFLLRFFVFLSFFIELPNCWRNENWELSSTNVRFFKRISKTKKHVHMCTRHFYQSNIPIGTFCCSKCYPLNLEVQSNLVIRNVLIRNKLVSVNFKMSNFKELLQFMQFLNMSEHVETCLNLFRFNMIWIDTILKHVWTCSNMSKLVQIQYDINCYHS